MFISTSFVLFSVLAGALAAPSPRYLVPTRRAASVTSLAADELSDLARFTQFARAVYCPPEKIQGWQCGGNSILDVCTSMLFTYIYLRHFQRPAMRCLDSMPP